MSTYQPDHYEAVAAGASNQILGGAGAAGDFLDTITVNVTTTGATGTVTIGDGINANNIVVPASTPVGAFSLPIKLRSKVGGWRVSCGAGAQCICSGTFT